MNNALDDDSGDLGTILKHRGIAIPDGQVTELDQYREVLWSWNKQLNLTRHTTMEKFVGRDIVDSMALEPFLAPGDRVLDVGTGGGVPGMILAILRSDLEVVLTESVAKRASAVHEIAKATNAQLTVFHGRAEERLNTERFDSLVARAVAPLSKMLRWFEPHWDAIGQLLLIKGPAWLDERHEARESGLLRQLELRRLDSYPIPGTESESVILRIRPRT